MKRVLALVCALAWGCAPIPPPDVLSAADKARSAPAVEGAAAVAPAALAHAEELRREVEADPLCPRVGSSGRFCCLGFL